MKLYIDDLRDIPAGYVGCRTYAEAIGKFIDLEGQIECISFDHDLGEEKTGYDVCLWLVEHIVVEGYPLPKEINLHTANPVGRDNMYQLLMNYLPSVKITKEVK